MGQQPATRQRAGISRLTDGVVQALPWACLGLGAVLLTAALANWTALTPVDRTSLMSDAVTLPLAARPLHRRRYRGWLLLFIGTGVQIPYGIAGLLLGAAGGYLALIGRLLGVALTMAIILVLRPHYLHHSPGVGTASGRARA